MALNAAQEQEWRDFLAGLPDAVILSAVGAVGPANRTLAAFRAFGTRDAAQTSLIGTAGAGAVAGLPFDVALLMVERWAERRASAADSGNLPVVHNRVLTEALASRARGDTAGELSTALYAVLTRARTEAPDIEGGSDLCYVILGAGPDSSRVGRTAEGTAGADGGLALVTSETGAIEIVKKEWTKHLKSRADWRRFIERCRRAAIRHGRTGLADRFSEFTMFLDRMVWTLAVRYITRYMEEKEGRLCDARDQAIYLDVQMEWVADGSPGAGEPEPHSSHPPSGSRAPKSEEMARGKEVSAGTLAEMVKGMGRELEAIRQTLAEWCGAAGKPPGKPALAPKPSVPRPPPPPPAPQPAPAPAPAPAPRPALTPAAALVPAGAQAPASEAAAGGAAAKKKKRAARALSAAKCHNCGKEGHYARDCPDLSAEERAVKQEAARERQERRQAAPGEPDPAQ